MNIFNKLFGENKRFMSKEDAGKNFNTQTSLTPQTMTALRKHGVTESHKLKLEFFFYTNSSTKGNKLSRSLGAIGYTSKCGLSAGESDLYVITGWTNPLVMTDHNVLVWVKEMCVLGAKYDCEFDGWGTNPKQ